MKANMWIGVGVAVVAVIAIGAYLCSRDPRVEFNTIINKQLVYLQQGNPTPITLVFSEDKIAGFSGVNRYFAAYTQQDGDLSFRTVASTMMAGSEEDMAMETAYLQLLSKVNKVAVTKKMVTLYTEDQQFLDFKIGDMVQE